MNNNDRFSDELLHTFIDDEIDTQDRAEIMEAVRHDKDLAGRICELQQVKDSVHLAYREPPQSNRINTHWQSSRGTRLSIKTAAAVALFTIGSLTGWLMHTQPGLSANTPTSSIAQLAPEEHKRVVLHISTADPERLEQALDDAEQLLSGYKDRPGQSSEPSVAIT